MKVASLLKHLRKVSKVMPEFLWCKEFKKPGSRKRKWLKFKFQLHIKLRDLKALLKSLKEFFAFEKQN